MAVNKTNIKVETMITTIWVEASSLNLKVICMVETKEDSTAMLLSYHHKMLCHSHPISPIVHMDKIIIIVGRMSCQAARAHSTAPTTVIKVETCKIVKAQTKNTETKLEVLNGRPSPRISTSHKQLQ